MMTEGEVKWCPNCDLTSDSDTVQDLLFLRNSDSEKRRVELKKQLLPRMLASILVCGQLPRFLVTYGIDSTIVAIIESNLTRAITGWAREVGEYDDHSDAQH